MDTPEFSGAQIDHALAILEEHPELIKLLISSAQEGNREDLEFLMELEEKGIELGFDDVEGGFIHRV